jgi:hypothetical protein
MPLYPLSQGLSQQLAMFSCTAGASRTAASVVSVNTDPDLDEFDRQVSGTVL